MLGVHLEGPYINPGRLGAQPDFAVTATLQDVLALHALAPLKLITIAPELPGHLALIVALRDHGFVVQIGHSAGSYEDGVADQRAVEQALVTVLERLPSAVVGLWYGRATRTE